MPERHPTTQRLIAEGMRLFAERGMRGTPVTLIEQASGLAPGSGAFYKHFRSKQELYEAAVADAALAMTTRATNVGDLGTNLREEATGIAKLTLATLTTMRDLLLVTMREADLPVSRDAWPASGHEWLARWLDEKSRNGQLDVRDPKATAVVLAGALLSAWQNSLRPAAVPLGVNQSRIVAAWVELVMHMSPGDTAS